MSSEPNYEYEYEYDYDVIENNLEPIAARYAILGIALTIGAVTSVLLMASSIFLRRQSCAPFFVVLASWSLANLFFLAVSATKDFAYHHMAWPFGEFWCHGFYYLSRSISCTRAYLMVLAALVTLLGNYRFKQWVGPRTLIRTATPVIASTLVWVLIFLPCMQYWYQSEYKAVGVARVAFWCVLRTGLALVVLECVFLFIVPSVLTAGALLAWACRKAKPKMADRKEKVQAIVLLIILHVFVVGNFLDRVVVAFAFHGSYLIHENNRGVFLARFVFTWIDHVMAPALSLVAILVYRRTLTSPEKQEEPDIGIEDLQSPRVGAS